MKVKRKTVLQLAEKYNINTEIIPINILIYALNVELEHGKRYEKIYKGTNITNDDYDMTIKIVISHLLEYPDYYKRLKSLEKQAEKYWENKIKPSIFNN